MNSFSRIFAAKSTAAMLQGHYITLVRKCSKRTGDAALSLRLREPGAIEERFHCAKNAQWGGGLTSQADRFIRMNREEKASACSVRNDCGGSFGIDGKTAAWFTPRKQRRYSSVGCVLEVDVEVLRASSWMRSG